MKTDAEIKEVMETIKEQLTRVDTEFGRVNLQGQYAALDWVISVEKKRQDGFAESEE